MTVNDDDIVYRLLAGVKLFRGFQRDELLALLGVAEKRQFAVGDEVFGEGDSGDSLYILLSGKVQVVKAARGRGAVLAYLHAGDSFGEMAVVVSGKRTASVRVKEACTTLRFCQTALAREPAAAARLYQNIARVLAERLDATNVALLFNHPGDLDTTRQLAPATARPSGTRSVRRNG